MEIKRFLANTYDRACGCVDNRKVYDSVGPAASAPQPRGLLWKGFQSPFLEELGTKT
jgi:hypothetical protein